MMWLSHRVVTASAVLVATHNLWFVVAATAGSTFPDKVEQWLPGDWRRHHRRASHWWPLYLVPFLACNGILFASRGESCFRTDRFFDVFVLLSWFIIGCLMHILEDSVCGKIPVWRPQKRVFLFPRLFYTGSVGENVFVLFFLLFSVFLFLNGRR